MTWTDVKAGVRHAWYFDRAEVGAFAAYQAVLAVVTVIAGASSWVLLVLLAAAFVPVVEKIVRRARAVRDSRMLYEWLATVEAMEPSDEVVEYPIVD